jgi:NAD(P)-dependent dehydrogenase (short-subunit alcohol dehydrogenase family)
MTSISGKVAVVTGAGSGIGRALAYDLARRGAKLAISDVDTVGLAETAQHARVIGAQVHEQFLDVTDRESVLAYAGVVAEHYGVVNIIINNAGIAFSGDIEEMTFEQIERVMDVDFWGVVNGTRRSSRTSSPAGTGTSSTSPRCSACSRCRARAPTTPQSSPYAASPRHCAKR